MELKNALAVCLISLVGATLVVLIVRALDSQAAARLEPQLVRIAEELEAIRRSGGLAASPGETAAEVPADEVLTVYYFHSNARCLTCRTIESRAREAVESGFAEQLQAGRVVWKELNYETRANAELARGFGVQIPVVVLAKRNGGQLEDWKRLDRVWALVGNPTEYAAYVQDEILAMLGGPDVEPTPAPPVAAVPPPAAPDLPLPGPSAPNLPVPDLAAPDLPVPDMAPLEAAPLEAAPLPIPGLHFGNPSPIRPHETPPDDAPVPAVPTDIGFPR
jgi:hypothetical protein